MSEGSSTDLATRIKMGPMATIILRKFKQGETATSISKWLQEEMLEYTAVPEVRLASELKKYFKEVVPLDERLAIHQQRGAIAETVSEYREKVAVLDELEKLYALQVGRIEIDHSTEKKIRKLFGSTNNEIELARRMLGDIAKLRLELGVDRRAPSQVDITTGGQPMNSLDVRLGIVAKKLIEGIENGPTVEALGSGAQAQLEVEAGLEEGHAG